MSHNRAERAVCVPSDAPPERIDPEYCGKKNKKGKRGAGARLGVISNNFNIKNLDVRESDKVTQGNLVVMALLRLGL